MDCAAFESRGYDISSMLLSGVVQRTRVFEDQQRSVDDSDAQIINMMERKSRYSMLYLSLD